MILAVVAGAIKATATGTALSMIGVGIITAKALAFLIGSIALGHFIVPRLLRGAGRLESRGVLLTLAISFCLFLPGLRQRLNSLQSLVRLPPDSCSMKFTTSHRARAKSGTFRTCCSR